MREWPFVTGFIMYRTKETQTDYVISISISISISIKVLVSTLLGLLLVVLLLLLFTGQHVRHAGGVGRRSPAGRGHGGAAPAGHTR